MRKYKAGLTGEYSNIASRIYKIGLQFRDNFLKETVRPILRVEELS